MLVVVAIIGLLIAIVTAAASPIREAARQRVCQSNVRQIGIAMRMYIDDYGGGEAQKGTASSCADLGIPSIEHLRGFTLEYVKNRSVLFCPDYHGVRPARTLGMTYRWGAMDGRGLPSYVSFSSIVKQRGGEAVVLSCEQHNVTWDRGAEPRWALKRVIVLRADGRVQNKEVPIQDTFLTW